MRCCFVCCCIVCIFSSFAYAGEFLARIDGLSPDRFPDYVIIERINDQQVLALVDEPGIARLAGDGVAYSILDENPRDHLYFLVYVFGDDGVPLEDYATILYRFDDCILIRTVEENIQHLNRFKVELKRITFEPVRITVAEPFEYPVVRYNPLIQQMVDAVAEDSMYSYIHRMQNMYTRYCTSDSNEYVAAPWIRDKLLAYGCDTVYLENFSGSYGPNIVGIKWGEVYPDTYCIIMGHMDDVPSSGFAPGADDNASGTAAAIEAARVLNDYEFEYTIRYILVNAEEVGLVGSEYYATNAYYQGHTILGVVNYDMIGYTETYERLDVHYTVAVPGCSVFVCDFFQTVADEYTQLWIRPRRNTGTSGYSDHASFWQVGYIALLGIENPLCPGYHTTADSIGPYGVNNLPFATLVTKTGVAAIAELAKPIGSTGPHVTLDRSEVTGGNGNGRLDPGEDAGIVCYVRNVGDSAATGTNATLRTADGYVTVLDSTTSYGTVLPGDSANNSGDPFDVSVSSACPEGYEVEFDLFITCAETSWTRQFSLIVGLPGFDFVTHDCGNVKLSVTRYGAIGYMNSDQTAGDGFCYPVTSANHLYYGSFTIGTDASYVVDRFKEYNGIDDADWVTTVDPDGKARMFEPGPGTFDEYATGRYDDTGHPLTKGLVCEQRSWAWDDAQAEDFVIMQFILYNEGSTVISDVYAALFMDWDIGTYNDNQGSSDSLRRLTWMYQSTPYCGVSILDPDTLTPAANLVLIDNTVYIHPNDGLADSNQIKFMDATIQNPSSDRPTDWTTCNSIGPFTLVPDDTLTVAFAILGGNNLSDLQANADTAYVWYWGSNPAVAERIVDAAQESFAVYPLITRSGRVSLLYTVPHATMIALKAYDAAGRLVNAGTIPRAEGSGSAVFDLSRCAQGVYFVTVRAGGQESIHKVVIVR